MGRLVPLDHAPAAPPGQMRVNERLLSGFVVKIGSPKKFFADEKQWKYLVLYVDQRGPMNSGTIGRSWRKSFSSWVAIACCFLPSRVTFHWFRSAVARSSEKCSQFPLGLASCPDGMKAFLDRFV